MFHSLFLVFSSKRSGSSIAKTGGLRLRKSTMRNKNILCRVYLVGSKASKGNWTAADSRCFEYLWITASSKVSFGHRPQWHARPHSNRECENMLKRKIWLIAALHLLLPPFVPPYLLATYLPPTCHLLATYLPPTCHLLATYLPPWSRNPKQSEEITSSCVFSRLHFHHVFSTPETPWDPCRILRFQASL